MFRRFFLILLCFIMAFLMCAPAPSMAANPPDYERAKAQLARLHSGRHSAAEWQACADAFRKAYDRNPKWRLRSAALYRYGVALEGRARVTRSAADARRAAAAYEQTVRSYPDSVLADDALFRAAIIHNEQLRSPARARAHLERIGSRYPKSDHAAPAASYLAKMLKKPGKKAEAKQGGDAAKGTAHKKQETKKKVAGKPAPKKEPAKKAAPPQEKARKPASKKEAAPARAPAPKEKPIARNLAAQLGLAVRTVVIDAGHGGHDPGAVHHGVVEKDVNLDVAKRLGSILKKRGYTVKYTRESNKWLALGDRVRKGKNMRGDLFISIHVNACENTKASGFETYILDFARTSSASRLATIENANSSRLGDMDKIVSEILRGARTAESRRLADCIQSSALDHLRRQKYKVHDGGVKGAPFFVLVGSTMPSVLVEIGYCSNRGEALRLKDPKYRQYVAQGIANGIHGYAKGLAAR